MTERQNNIPERRKFIRLNSSVEIQYTVLDEGANQGIKTKSRNIGSGGMGFVASQKLENNKVLGLSIYMPGELMPIIAKGRVVWASPFESARSKGFDIGSEFLEIAPEDRKKINSYIHSLRQS